MEVAEGSVLDRLPERLSPSRLANYMQCPAKFFFGTIKKIPQVPTAAQLRGTLAHEAIEKVFDVPAGKRTPELTAAGVRPAWERLDAKDDTYANLRDEIEPIIAEAEAMCRSWFGVEDPNRINPKACETWVRGEVGGVAMHGIIDRLDEIPVGGEDKLVVSDYKSAIKVPTMKDRFIDEKFFGMQCYAAMLDYQGTRPAAIRLVFISGGTPSAALTKPIGDKEIAATNKTVKAVGTDMKRSAKAGQFACKTGPLCNWCDYFDLCPAQQAHLDGVPVSILNN